jgi:hypothetical protein
MVKVGTVNVEVQFLPTLTLNVTLNPQAIATAMTLEDLDGLIQELVHKKAEYVAATRKETLA